MSWPSNNKPSFKKWDKATIVWLIIIALIGAVILYAFLREEREEEEFQKHINLEHHHSS